MGAYSAAPELLAGGEGNIPSPRTQPRLGHSSFALWPFMPQASVLRASLFRWTPQCRRIGAYVWRAGERAANLILSMLRLRPPNYPNLNLLDAVRRAGESLQAARQRHR